MCDVLVKVKVNYDLTGKTKEEVLALIKRTMGGYNEHDISRVVEVISFKKDQNCSGSFGLAFPSPFL